MNSYDHFIHVHEFICEFGNTKVPDGNIILPVSIMMYILQIYAVPIC